MKLQLLAPGVVLASVLAVGPVAAQVPTNGSKGPQAKGDWTRPKTPWGHPDISGTWTSDGAIGIPRERPDEFAGRAELTDAEFADKLKRDEATRKRSDAT